ncbi:galactose mutarotase-like protein [Basidiobolus meristosporus CBS 931.73]|uniref:Glucose-6-phosphate 1-epimerase n=1 Tax=Basidiobolus meristosporus CBS 931.73 TaxID=1314790 RepID=A0A1Y1Y638_9FUNG|nr:galactose mutarotase-like protein [Basidiobolus meristosporus CBS 931.73]|eukprot:ORX93429.1 galactose mutarotase-like protein [Basidiobolus meristosporus CBS 931.73]
MSWSGKAVQIVQAEDGSPDQIILTHPEGATTTISLYGATVTSWKVKDVERLFVSQKAILNGTKAIRGGIPLVFPNFGKAEAPNPASGLPQHGFARVTRWQWLGTVVGAEDEVKVRFGLNDVQIGPDFRSIWPFAFELVYTVTLKVDTLETTLTVKNTESAESKKSFDFTTLLHTYFQVPDVTKASVSGLHGYKYTDKVQGVEASEERSTIQVDSEVDSVYKNVTSLEIKLDDGNGKALLIKKNNLDDTVVWNPWIEKANGMADFGDDEYKNMICVECGTVVNPVKLNPGEVWEGGQVIQAAL